MAPVLVEDPPLAAAGAGTPELEDVASDSSDPVAADVSVGPADAESSSSVLVVRALVLVFVPVLVSASEPVAVSVSRVTSTGVKVLPSVSPSQVVSAL